MKITIEKTETTKEEIEITLPYYCKSKDDYYLIYGEGFKETLKVCTYKHMLSIEQTYNDFPFLRKDLVQIQPNEFHKVYDEVTNELLILLNNPFKLDAQKLAGDVIETIKTIGE